MTYVFRELDMMIPAFEVKGTDTAQEALRKVKAQINSSPDGAKLNFEGKDLDPHKTLDEQGVPAGKTINIVWAAGIVIHS